jgi:flagellar basal-body rod protein FlgG
MLVNQVRLEVIGNNLANLKTPGFKRGEVVNESFPETFMHYQGGRALPGQRHLLAGSIPAALPALRPIGVLAENVAVDTIYHMRKPGALRLTEDPLDFAIQGEGYFVLETPQGLRYTRDGNFHVNSEGFLVNSQGFGVMGERGLISLGEQHPKLHGEKDLHLNGRLVDRLRIVAFLQESLLAKDGFNLFREGGNQAALPAERAVVRQGYLEESNADLLRQMTQLVTVRRSYEAAQKIAQTYDRLLGRAANELGSLR